MDSQLKTFMASLRKMKDNAVMTDVTLKLPDDSTIPCHKLVLITASPFFETMFQSGLKESTEQDVQLEFSDADTIRILVEFIYSGEISVNEDNIQTLVAASEFLFLDDLKAHCEDFMTTLIRSSNHQELCNFGRKFNLKNLLSSACEFIILNFKEVVEMPAFETLTENELVEVVSDDRLRTDNEDIVFESVVRWVKADPDQRKEAVSRIAPSIRFPLCTRETLSMVVSCEPLMWNPDCMKLIAEAQHSQFHSGKQHVQNARTTPRLKQKALLVQNAKYVYPHNYLVRLYNDQNNKVCFEYTASIDEEPVKWEVNSLDFISKLTKGQVLTSESGVVWVINDKARKSVDLKSKKITAHPWRKPTVRTSTFIARSTQILAFGGNNRNTYRTFQAFDITKNKCDWTYASDLLEGVHDAHVVLLSHHIFIFGGYTDSNCSQPSQTTQKYTVATHTWSMCSSMPGACTFGQAVALNDEIYVVGGNERVCFCYDPKNDMWTVLTRPPTCFVGGCATVLMGKIILIGKNDSTGQVYDPRMDRWSLKENLFLEETKQHESKLLCTMRF